MVRLMKGITQKLLVTDREYRKSGWNGAPHDGVFKILRGERMKRGELHDCRGSSKTAFPEKKKKKKFGHKSLLCTKHTILGLYLHTLSSFLTALKMTGKTFRFYF